MDATAIFRQIPGYGTYVPRPPPPPPPHAVVHARRPPVHIKTEDDGDHDASHRIAHTLTACCRCRQRKTRCDPKLPRCLPCERSGSACEYYDTAKGKRISRNYVVRLQEKVRALEAELGQYTDDDDYPKDHEDFIRPGGLVRLNETDETPRYLGPSSGIAMTRILMEEAKRYTDSKRISELIPGVRGRRPHGAVSHHAPGANGPGPRSQSFSMPPVSRKKSYPMISAVAAEALPSRAIADRLVEVFHQRAQVFTPTLHEKTLADALENVYACGQDPYENFVVRLVMAISMQKLDATYAGLADSYYLAAMQYFEDVVRPKDIKTLQCLVLIGQYSLLTPTRTAVYYVVGLATRICQQLGLADEKTIALGADDALALDMRRRLSWIVTNLEFGLAQSMGRPSGFAKTGDLVDVEFFEVVPDAAISEAGVVPGPPDEKKLVAIHFCRMRLHQAEIRRTLYEQKQHEPRDDRHPWFAAMEAKMDRWLQASPESPSWCKPWFTGRYHSMMVALHRPSPQVPRPSVSSATKCFDSAAFIINISSKQMMAAAIDITWVFLLTLYMSLNTVLWSVTSYPAVRLLHGRDEVQELVNVALDMIDQCVERWPGTAAASDLYSTFTRACLQSYDADDTPLLSSASTFNTPPSQPDIISPDVSDLSASGGSSKPAFHPPQFGYVFGSTPEEMNGFGSLDGVSSSSSSLLSSFPGGQHPTFRSNSIFENPASNDHTGRRFSYFPPDFTQADNPAPDEEEPSPPATEVSTLSPFLSPPPLPLPLHQQQHQQQQMLSTPPESLATPTLGSAALAASAVTTPLMTLRQATPTAAASLHSNSCSPEMIPPTNGIHNQQQRQRPPPPPPHSRQQQQPRSAPIPFATPSLPSSSSSSSSLRVQPPPPRAPPGQRPLPQPQHGIATPWFNPPTPFIAPYTFGGGGGYWNPGGGGRGDVDDDYDDDDSSPTGPSLRQHGHHGGAAGGPPNGFGGHGGGLFTAGGGLGWCWWWCQ
ncbi:hypothetical protein GGR56DRAFT_58849 [Xylariaceae sp. FL0804]|nr:hypothetical protein GGR56DRAFT_58849 [Xylariaceae sp. FL0804]